MTAALALTAAVATSAAAVALMRRYAGRLPRAVPNARSLHEGDVPRVGGAAILAGIAIAALIGQPPMQTLGWTWLAALAAVAAVSLVDDVRGVHAALRLLVHLVAATLVVVHLVDVAAAPAVSVIFILGIVWGANLFNFMDGSDGLAAMMAIIGFATYALAAGFAGKPWAPYAAIVGAALPFLLVNLPRATMFMGDVGAVPLGFLAAALGVAGAVADTWPAWFPMLVFMPFLADATLTLLARALRGEPVWQSHRAHFYQRFNTLGAGHRGTLAVYAALMLASAAFAVVCLTLVPHAWPLALSVALALHLLVFAVIDYHWRKRQAVARR